MAKKKKAIGNMLTCLICLVVMFAVVYFAVYVGSFMRVGIEKSRIERRFMLQMETDGYLSPSVKDKLIEELARIGVSDVSLDGTTMVPAGYGNDVILSVTGRLNIALITGMSSHMTWIYGGSSVDFRIYQISTAKN